MPAGRTGTGKWKNLRAKALTNAIQAGQLKCPLCNTHLDYEYGKHPNSAEVDHIKPYALGGQDTLTNLRVICRKCNQSRGGKQGRTKQLTQIAQRTKAVHPTVHLNW